MEIIHELMKMARYQKFNMAVARFAGNNKDICRTNIVREILDPIFKPKFVASKPLPFDKSKQDVALIERCSAMAQYDLMLNSEISYGEFYRYVDEYADEVKTTEERVVMLFIKHMLFDYVALHYEAFDANAIIEAAKEDGYKFR